MSVIPMGLPSRRGLSVRTTVFAGHHPRRATCTAGRMRHLDKIHTVTCRSHGFVVFDGGVGFSFHFWLSLARRPASRRQDRVPPEGVNVTMIREATWWRDCVDALRSESLASLSARFKVQEAELCEALASESAGLPADKAVWWPEALRMRVTFSLRAIARTFHTDPRRLRRALARAGLRVGGREIAEHTGVPQLSGLRDVLGREPDRAVAKMGGVIPEAVQGERMRLNIPAYVQRRRVRLSREEEDWIRGPKRGRRAKVQVEENLQVVRRTTRTDEHAHRPSGWGVGFADPRPRPTSEVPFRSPRVERDFFRSSGADEMEQLLQPVRQRDGRQRIVRSEPPRTLPPDSMTRGSIAPGSVTAESAPSSSSPSVAPGTRRIVTARVSSSAASPAAPPLDTDVRPALPSLSGVARAPRGTALVSSARASAASVSAAPVSAAPVSAAPVTGDVEWVVSLPGNDAPVRVHAPDIVQAIAAAGRIVPADLLRLASVWRADEPS